MPVFCFARVCFIEPCLLWFSLLVRHGLSYGVRHMHSIVPYYLIELMLYCAIYAMLIFTILFSVSLIVARYALSIKYRGSADPSIRDVESKALYSLARI